MPSRRTFLAQVAAIGGLAAAYDAAWALGLVEGEEAWTGPPQLPEGAGSGARVVILGAGMAGLAAGYELSLAGYHCTILEAAGRPGGRNWTIRGGDKVVQDGRPDQICEFEPGLYFNAGPGRIPAHHQATLGYCREFEIPLEPLVNHVGAGLIQADRLNGGQPFEIRRAIHDTRGEVASLLAKSVRRGGADEDLGREDLERLESFLRRWGQLDAQGAYAGASPAGYARAPGAGAQVAAVHHSLGLGALIDPFVVTAATFHDAIDMQPAMFAPKGGMDAIPRAFAKRLAPTLRTGRQVTALRRHRSGVAIEHRDAVTGRSENLRADYCICTLPLSVMAGIASDISGDRKRAISAASYLDAGKIAYQSPRFWERENGIYGGLSFTARDTFVTWYPSDAPHAAKGVLVAGYMFGPPATRFAALSPGDQDTYARGSIDRLHPDRGRLLGAPVAVNWRRTPYARGFSCSLDLQDEAAYRLLGEFDGPILFAGEHLSHVGAWMQGAIVSAHRAAVLLDARHRRGAPVTATRKQ